MKRCNKCKEIKALSEYCKDKSKTDELHRYCKPCNNALSAKWFEKNRNKDNARCRKWRAENLEKERARNRKWYRANRAKKNAITSRRRAQKLQAAIKITKEEKKDIEILYKVASYLTKRTGKQYHIDHVLPLKNDKVCGLHVLANLQILEAKENMSKGNKFGGEQ